MGEGKVGIVGSYKLWCSYPRNDDVERCRTLSDLLVLSLCSLKEFDSESSIDSNDLGHTTIQLGATRRDPWVWNKLSLAALGGLSRFPGSKVGDLCVAVFFGKDWSLRNEDKVRFM